MSLHRKFAGLLAVLGLTVLGSVLASIWSFGVLQREVSRPFQSIASVMDGLNAVKRNIEGQVELITGQPRISISVPGEGGTGHGDGANEPDRASTADDRREFEARSADIAGRLEDLHRNEWYIARAGRGTSENLRRRIGAALADARAWFEAPDPRRAVALAQEMGALHELIEKIEGKILDDAALAIRHDEGIRTRLYTVLGLASLVAVLIGVLGSMLVQRWVMDPVAALRAAAARIASGDLSHRIDVAGEDELAMLSGEVNHMAEMVHAMQEERVEHERLAAVGEMVRRLAHNIRNPLAGIRSLAELTRADVAGNPDLSENQDRIIGAVDRFESWLKELLNATSPMTVHPEPTPVRPLLAALVSAHVPMAAMRGITIDLDQRAAPDRAVFDSRHLEHALVAILSNAIEVSPANGRVGVTARYAGAENGSRDGETWEVQISDHGPGVPPDLMGRIFKPYFTTKRDGNGIGLAIAHGVVKAHGGRILVTSGSTERANHAGTPHGATFTVRLPLHGPTSPEDPQANHEPVGAQRGESSDRRG